MKIILAIIISLFSIGVIAQGVYQQPTAFLNGVFNHKIPKARMIWLTRARRLQISKILGHKPNRMRIRYWKRNQRTAWILDEIGKEKPITTGIVINKGRIELMKVLIFRETRGWEVRYPFFTNQFKGNSLNNFSHIDGISGATLSVRALKKLAKLSLYLHKQQQGKRF
jgi:hypothetical protein